MNKYRVKYWRKSKIADREDQVFEVVSFDSVVAELKCLVNCSDPAVAFDIAVVPFDA